MKILEDIIEKGEVPGGFYRFFNPTDEEDSLTLECFFKDDALPRASREENKVYRLEPNGETVSTQDIKPFLKNKIETEFKRGNDYTVVFSFIDFRMFNLRRKCRAYLKLNKNDEDKKIELIDEVEISNLMLTLAKNNPEILDSSEIVKKVIDHQFNTITRRWFTAQLFIFFFLVFLPFIFSVFTQTVEINFICSQITLFGMVYFELLEII